MKSNNFAATPYLSDAPLCELTDWLAIKMTITGKSSNYTSALAKVKDINEKLETVCEQASNNECQYISSDETYDDLAPSLQLEKHNSEHVAILAKNIVIELPKEIAFWQKMQTITQFIDEITQYSDQFKLDKMIDIKIGCENHTQAMI